MSNFYGRPLVRPYHTSWKEIHSFKEKFFRVCPGPNYPRFFHHDSGDPLFPFYWTEHPHFKIRRRTLSKSDVDEQLISLLRQATPIQAPEVLGNECDREKLTCLLCVSSSIVTMIILTLLHFFFCKISRDGTTYPGRTPCS